MASGKAFDFGKFGAVFGFSHVLPQEIAEINRRRRTLGRRTVELELRGQDPTGEPVLSPVQGADLVGLALSGGGIRSTAFCLGALQALVDAGVLEKVDYLSTVAGGGYIGCSLSSGLQRTEGSNHIFRSRSGDETPSMQHIRNYANYLFPNGVKDLPTNVAIYMRGLIANFVLIMPFLLVAASLTVFARSQKITTILSRYTPHIFGAGQFGITIYLIMVLLFAGIFLSVLRSFKTDRDQIEVRAGFTGFVGGLVLIVIISAFIEFDALVLDGMVAQQDTFFVQVFGWIKALVAALAPVVVVVALFANRLGEIIKNAMEARTFRSRLAKYIARAAVYFVASFAPLLLWTVYLYITYWGICAGAACSPAWLKNLATVDGVPKFDFFYLLASFILFFLALLLRPNAISLYPLYRDRLGNAFLFQPASSLRNDARLLSNRIRLSDLSGELGPYHLINATLNVQSARATKKRGRNADFFLFSQNFVGSETTGYVTTEDIERVESGLDLATAMVVSGVGASSNLGARSISEMLPTLGFLNLRFGYWLRNPSRVARQTFRNIWVNFYFLYEMCGLLNERKKSVYLTNGGHIENLGVYQLLKRRCRVIIAVDAEADSEMAFGSFSTMLRYARIDLGLEIDLPWQEISHTSLATAYEIDQSGESKKLKGPHCAIGEITYPNGQAGIIIYIKPSLTGDESDDVIDYKRRYPAFPHETTLDPMFSQEQFEAYRALGHHATIGLLAGRDSFAHRDPEENPETRAEMEFLDQLFPGAGDGRPVGESLPFAKRLRRGEVGERLRRGVVGEAD